MQTEDNWAEIYRVHQ